jgi:hypothetical protein
VNLAKERLAEDNRAFEESQRLIHELRVRQFELEIQNEELRRVRDERQEMETILREYCNLYDLAPVGYLIMDNHGIDAVLAS